MRRFLVTYSLLLIIVLSGYAQTVELAPNGIKQCLVDNYSSLLDGSERLDTTLAKGITTTLDCANKGVVNTQDLQYFTGVRDLKLNNNDIVDLAGIATLTQLVTIDVTSNELEFVPNLTTFYSLAQFDANYNQMDNFPVFPDNIQTIRVGNNSLAGTIDVTGKSQLMVFEAFENDIANLKGIETTNLVYGDFHTNELEIIKDLSGLSNLEHLDLSDNWYKDLPLLSTNKLTYLDVSSNSLTFEDLIPYADVADKPNVFIQAKPETATTINLNEGEVFEWKLSFDTLVTSNVYHWFKDGQELSTSSEGNFSLPSVLLSDSGVYHCEVENTTAGLTGGRLITNSIKLIIEENASSCFSITQVEVNVEPVSCQSIANVEVLADVVGETGSLAYELDGGLYNSSVFQVSEEGEFTLTLRDELCAQVVANKVTIEFDLENCEPPSFSPNGDGVDDDYYFDFDGQALIYNKKGELIQTLALPLAWDGRKSDNTMADTGLYVVIINGDTKVNLTLVR